MFMHHYKIPSFIILNCKIVRIEIMRKSHFYTDKSVHRFIIFKWNERRVGVKDSNVGRI